MGFTYLLPWKNNVAGKDPVYFYSVLHHRRYRG